MVGGIGLAESWLFSKKLAVRMTAAADFSATRVQLGTVF
jgi:hypothetical protein